MTTENFIAIGLLGVVALLFIRAGILHKKEEQQHAKQ